MTIAVMLKDLYYKLKWVKLTVIKNLFNLNQ
jgi:hypothetical protein